MACLALACCALLGCHSSSTSVAHGNDQPPRREVTADVMSVTKAVWPRTVRTQGSLAADERAEVGAKVSGRVAETLVDLGEAVRQGQPLVRLEIVDFDLQVQRAEAQLAEACAAIGIRPEDASTALDPQSIPFVVVEKVIWEESQETLDRLIRLHEKKAVSRAELDKQTSLTRVAAARFDAALSSVEEKVALIRSRRTELAQAKQDREDATIRAPFAGIIERRHLAEGSFVQPGTAVVTLVRIDPLRFQGRVPERKATSIRVGQPMRIYIEGETVPLDAEVLRVSPALELASRSLRIEAEIPNSDFRYRSGLFAEGDVEVDSDAQTIAIPRLALGEFAGVYKVWIVSAEENLMLRPVQVGRQETDRVEIVSGLDANERILQRFADAESRSSSASAQD